PTITPAELADELAGPSPPILVDVRSAAEWALGHLPGARHLPLDTLSARLSELPTSAAVVAYCQSGRRSAAAVGVLREHGRPNARSLAGGLTAWEAPRAAAPPRRRRSRTL